MVAIVAIVALVLYKRKRSGSSAMGGKKGRRNPDVAFSNPVCTLRWRCVSGRGDADVPLCADRVSFSCSPRPRV